MTNTEKAIQSIESTLVTMNKRFDLLEDMMVQLIGIVKDVKVEQAEMKADIKEIKAEQTEMKADIKELKQGQARLEQASEEQKQALGELAVVVLNQGATLRTLKQIK